MKELADEQIVDYILKIPYSEWNYSNNYSSIIPSRYDYDASLESNKFTLKYKDLYQRNFSCIDVYLHSSTLWENIVEVLTMNIKEPVEILSTNNDYYGETRDLYYKLNSYIKDIIKYKDERNIQMINKSRSATKQKAIKKISEWISK